MQNQSDRHDYQPFPLTRPEIRIVESREKITEIDCLDLQWWFAIPRLHDHTMSAFYEIDTLALSAINDLVTVGPAMIEQVPCVEIKVDVWPMRADWPMASQPVRFYSSVDDTRTGWVGVAQRNEGGEVLRTFRDKGFEQDWGMNGKRKLYDDGRYQRQPDGTYHITTGQGLGAGVYEVTIGDQTFCCLRVLDIGPTPSEHSELGEAFVTQEGRTVLYRQYQGRLWGNRARDLVEIYPSNARLVIDGCVYVHCNCTGRAHDVITNTAVGAFLSKRASIEKKLGKSNPLPR